MQRKSAYITAGSGHIVCFAKLQAMPASHEKEFPPLVVKLEQVCPMMALYGVEYLWPRTGCEDLHRGDFDRHWRHSGMFLIRGHAVRAALRLRIRR